MVKRYGNYYFVKLTTPKGLSGYAEFFRYGGGAAVTQDMSRASKWKSKATASKKLGKLKLTGGWKGEVVLIDVPPTIEQLENERIAHQDEEILREWEAQAPQRAKAREEAALLEASERSREAARLSNKVFSLEVDVSSEYTRYPVEDLLREIKKLKRSESITSSPVQLDGNEVVSCLKVLPGMIESAERSDDWIRCGGYMELQKTLQGFSPRLEKNVVEFRIPARGMDGAPNTH